MNLRRGGASTTALLALTACGSEPVVVFLPADLGRSTILITVDARDQRRLFASELGESRHIELGAVTDRLDLYALYYGCTLTALGLEPGEQHILEGEEGESLPATQRTRSSELREGRPMPWRDMDRLPAPIEKLRLSRRPEACVDLELTPLPLEGTSDQLVTAAAPIGPNELLLGTDRGLFFLVSPDGARRLTSLSSSTPSQAAFVGEDGELWLAANDGSLVRGTLEAGFRAAPSMTSTAGVGLRMTGSLPPAPFELFAWSRSLVLERFDGDRWRRLSLSDPVSTTGKVDLVWIGAGEAMALSSSRRSVVFHAVGERFEVERFEGPLRDDKPFALAQIPGFGVVLAAVIGGVFDRNDSTLFRYDGTSWSELPTGELQVIEVSAIAPFPGGFVIGGAAGLIQQYHERSGFCESSPGDLRAEPIGRLLPIEGGLMAIPRFTTSGRPIELHHLRHPLSSCSLPPVDQGAGL